MSNKLIEVENLFIRDKEGRYILKNFDFSLEKEQIHAIIGESGSGKTSFALSIFKLNNQNLHITFKKFDLIKIPLDSYSTPKLEDLRGKVVSLIPQNPISAFHPYRKVGSQIMEFFRLKKSPLANLDSIMTILSETGIASPDKKIKMFPNELSGGERQRILISMAFALKPKIIVADEPTTALDPVNEKKVLKLLYALVQKNKTGMVLITHDLRIVKEMADMVTVLKNGLIVEKFSITQNSMSITKDYTKKLLNRFNIKN
ncbi:MAG: ABC transporter ATP-binding protein [Leptospiraceae bacterium]|nr:ABC transporter ATP-binding protein [Leptospiraceae bacterium]MCP5497374.1 ABC transporter ATP-binding protein [Leptospiraceae bacterium]